MAEGAFPFYNVSQKMREKGGSRARTFDKRGRLNKF